MKKIILLFTSILIFSCSNFNENKKSDNSIPMTKINDSEIEGDWVSLIQTSSLEGWHYFNENGNKIGWSVDQGVLAYDPSLTKFQIEF